MFRFLDRFGLPIKYAVTGVVGGLIWLTIATLFDLQVIGGVFGTLGALAVGGFVGGLSGSAWANPTSPGFSNCAPCPHPKAGNDLGIRIG